MESLITQHSIDLLNLMIWAFLGVSSAFVGVLVWIGLHVAGELSGIRIEIIETNKTLAKIDRDLRNELSEQSKILAVHDYRLAQVERK